MVTKHLRDRLIGTWSLVSYEERPVDRSKPIYPMGPAPKGLIIYSPDGFMSAQVSKPDRESFASGDWFDATDAEFRAEGTSYIAYTGPFSVDEENSLLTHSVFISLFPNWVGQAQLRVARIEGDRLFLASASPVPSNGKLVTFHLIWRRETADARAQA